MMLYKYVVSRILLLTLIITSFSYQSLYSLDSTHIVIEETIEGRKLADLSVFTLDIKYNKKDGVKICEVQQGIVSLLTGFDYIHDGKESIADQFVKFLSKFNNVGWYTWGSVQDQTMKKVLQENQWKEFNHFNKIEKDDLFLKMSKSPATDLLDLSSFQGFIWTTYMKPHVLKEYREKYPGILFIDAATYTFLLDKEVMYNMLNWNDELKKFNPKWKSYKKRYTKGLAKKIINDIGSDILVIKPLKGARGNGVIITEASNLDKELKIILKTPKKKLYQNQDGAYAHWAFDNYDHFTVEEFFQSDLVDAPHLGNGLYDATMRVVCAMAYHQQKLELCFLGQYWKLPTHSVTDNVSLTTRHKSDGHLPYFREVDPEVQREVESKLTNMLFVMYREMLKRSPFDESS